MAELPEIRTPRLLLRGFRDADREPFAALNADARVMEHLPGLLTRAQSDAMIERIRAHAERHGFGLWAVEIIDDRAPPASCIGYVGLQVPGFAAAFQPCVEIGWRLSAAHWGHGYATEAARAVLAHGFGPLGLAELVSFTVPQNLPSRRVMERLGMHHDVAGDFDHPNFPPGHRLCRHVLYRLPRQTWRAQPARC